MHKSRSMASDKNLINSRTVCDESADVCAAHQLSLQVLTQSDTCLNKCNNEII